MTPVENVQVLANYWKFASSNEALGVVANRTLFGIRSPEFGQRLYGAMLAMKELCRDSASNTHARLNVFAANAIFETALLGRETTGVTDRVLAIARAEPSILRAMLAKADSKLRAPREIMLDTIYDAGTGGLFSPQDPSGLTSWLRSVDVGASAISGALQSDPSAAVRAGLLRITRDLAIPVSIAELLEDQRVFEALTSLLAVSKFSTQERQALHELSLQALARVKRTFQANLPTFPTGDGVRAPTLPPALPWYKQPMVAGVGIIGAIVGGALGARAR